MQEIESAKALESQEVEYPPVETTKEGGWRKYSIAMVLIIISSVFVFMRIMDVDTWIFFVGTVGAGYLGVNVYQKMKLP
jgi:hypothetical protein